MHISDPPDSGDPFWKGPLGLQKTLSCVEAHLVMKRVFAGLGGQEQWGSRIIKSWITPELVLQKGFGNFDHLKFIYHKRRLLKE